MAEHVMGKSCVHDYESVWLSRWTQRGSGFKSHAHISNRDAKCSTKINLPEDGQLLKESTSSMKPNEKMLSGSLDLFSNPDIPDMNKEPPMVANRENLIDGKEGESSGLATKNMNVIDFLNENTKLFKECKRIRLDHETNSRPHVKRLKKINASSYGGNETKSMVVLEGPSGKTRNAFFHKILTCGINKPISRTNQEPFTSHIKNLRMGRGEDKYFTLMDPWIQRWYNKNAAQTNERKRGQEVNPKSTVLEKQFPSIAAMALMVNALRRFKPKWS